MRSNGSKRTYRRAFAVTAAAGASVLAAACLVSIGEVVPAGTDGSTADVAIDPTATAADASVTSCDGGRTLCEGTCVDIQSDPLHCGGCEHDCRGARCAAGFCPVTTVPTSIATPRALLLKNGTLYVSVANDTSVALVGVDGGLLQSVVGGLRGSSTTIDVGDDGTIYWSDFNGYGPGVLGSLTTTDAGPLYRSRVFDAGVYNGIDGIKVVGDTLFFVSHEENAVVRMPVPLAGDAEATRIMGPEHRLVHPTGLAIAGMVVFAGNNTSIETGKVDGTSTFVPPVTALDQVGSIAVDSSHLYYANVGDAGYLARLPLQGGPTQVLAELTSIGGLAVDEHAVYWTEPATGLVRKVPLAGGPPIVLAVAQSNPRGIALDETFAYWANDVQAGSIGRVAK